MRTTATVLRRHPWHGVPIGPESPAVVSAYIEIVPSDTVKYRLDETTGILAVDRPQAYSNACPALYGLIPQTLCADRVGAFCTERTGRSGLNGDGGPLDLCVLTEKRVAHGGFVVQAIPIGGLRLLDGSAADDKIIAVLKGDGIYRGLQDVHDCPAAQIDQLRHYFLTYEQHPDADGPASEITHVYGRLEAYEVIRRSTEDYRDRFGGV